MPFWRLVRFGKCFFLQESDKFSHTPSHPAHRHMQQRTFLHEKLNASQTFQLWQETPTIEMYFWAKKTQFSSKPTFLESMLWSPFYLNTFQQNYICDFLKNQCFAYIHLWENCGIFVSNSLHRLHDIGF
jgi:hypothetical protein